MDIEQLTDEELAGQPAAYWTGVVLKTGLVLLLLLPLLEPDLEQYAGKGMNWRILVFPIAALVIPVLWRARVAAVSSKLRNTEQSPWESDFWNHANWYREA